MADEGFAMIDAHVIDEVFQGSIEALRASREQVFQIGESGREEMERIRALVEQVSEETRQCIANVDRLEEMSRRSRQRLAKINQDFSAYKDSEIREAYAEAERCLVQLGAAREREEALRRRRDDLTRQLKHLQDILGKADHVVSQVGMALDVLTGNWDKMSESVDGMRDQAALARRIIMAQEEERRRVARDIHDGPAQLLANLVMRVELMEPWLKEADPRMRDDMADLRGVVRDSLHELRRIIFNLRPMALDDLGIAPAVRGYIEVLREQLGLEVDMHIHGRERRLAPAAETALFRVLQEALSNVHRHSGVNRAAVVLEFTAEGVRMSVRDGGEGFDLASVEDRNIGARFGLLNMRERMRLLEGTFRVVTAPGQGTLVTVSLPWSEAASSTELGEGGGTDDGHQSADRG